MQRTMGQFLILKAGMLGGCVLWGCGALVGCGDQAPEPPKVLEPGWTQTDSQPLSPDQLSPGEEPGRLPPLDQEALDTLTAIRRQQGGIFAGSSFEGGVSPAAEQAEFQQALVQSQFPAPNQAAADNANHATALRAAAVALEHLAATAEAEDQPDAAERYRALAGELRTEVRRLSQPRETEKTGNPAPKSATAN